ncbi:MAG: cyanophycin synthetase, partial [Candidatus Omnitrophica bacterium]|nr:cyanophycin synthetase [Candidatus Omnitrophota bacterium]
IRFECIKAKKVAFSIQKKSDYQAQGVKQTEKGIEFSVRSQKFFIKTFSSSNVYNVLCAIIIGQLFKISMKEIKKSIVCMNSLKQRQNFYRTKKKFWMIDDTYNANPISVKAAIESLSCFPGKGRRIFVFGNMNELGLKSKSAHESVGRQVARSNIDYFVTVGEKAKISADALNSKTVKKESFFSCQSASKFLNAFIQPNDVILIKGSRGSHMEEIVQEIEQ